MSSDITNEMLCDLFEKSNLRFIGSSGRKFYFKLIKKCFRSKKMFLTVYGEEKPEAYLLSVADAKVVLPEFMLSSPILFIRFIKSKVTAVKNNRANASQKDKTEHHAINSSEAKYKWKDNGPEIAKVILIYVSENLRGKNVCSELYKRQWNSMQQYGIRRIDAQVQNSNLSSIKAHSKIPNIIIAKSETGWLFTKVEVRG